MQKSTKDTTLDIGDDRLVLHVNPAKYHLDLDLPFDVNNETCGAQFNRKMKVRDLTISFIFDKIRPVVAKKKTTGHFFFLAYESKPSQLLSIRRLAILLVKYQLVITGL